MKSLRRSLNNRDSAGTPPISPPVAFPALHKPSSGINPPKKVIRALQSYRPNAPQELSFSKGDFFHVVSEMDGWYEAHNPVSGSRGLVPKDCFEEFSKANAAARITTTSVSSSRSTPITGKSPTIRYQTFYATVLHDFIAERPDELGAKAGDPITVVAQSNEEWFVAKPIGKLGRPGLIPVSFVELRDPATNLPLPDVENIISRGDLPKVEDWKRAMQEYKQSSISLGVIEDKPSPKSEVILPVPQTQSLYQQQSIVPPEPFLKDRPPTPVSMQETNILPPGLVVSAEIVTFHFENDEYWFQINAEYHPDDPSLPARHLVLFRVYDDFYDFQVALLDAFPVEAGRQNGPPSPQSEGGPTETEPHRILPYMPGPVAQVDDVVTALRREELDDYLGQLCALRKINAEHVLRHPLVQTFFTPKPGDTEVEISRTGDNGYQVYDDVIDNVASLSLGKDVSRLSADSQYDDYAYSGDQTYQQYANSRSSTASLQHTTSPYSSYSPYDVSRPSYRRVDSVPYSDGGQSTSSSRLNNPMSPKISATNSQTAFLKVKIFHRKTDDLIAIRISPRVSHAQLMDKVRERLGGDIRVVSYRTSSGSFADLQDNYSLRDWLDHSDKYVLYAS
ncbi:hypothetical protein Clacol_001782 [Clathrus columnatus]|uniref:Uncharacterized protein n=1 Tax=Clathrus columnatus TaxID=1419009 RepID=A0AAV5A2T9_9AGAM|nr:hypothetical protein Clacol_001782 [Clathrus columnatus]